MHPVEVVLRTGARLRGGDKEQSAWLPSELWSKYAWALSGRRCCLVKQAGGSCTTLSSSCKSTVSSSHSTLEFSDERRVLRLRSELIALVRPGRLTLAGCGEAGKFRMGKGMRKRPGEAANPSDQSLRSRDLLSGDTATESVAECVVVVASDRAPSMIPSLSSPPECAVYFSCFPLHRLWLSVLTLSNRSKASSRIKSKKPSWLSSPRPAAVPAGEATLRAGECCWSASRQASGEGGRSDISLIQCSGFESRSSNHASMLPLWRHVETFYYWLAAQGDPKDGEIALWSATKRWYVVKCVSQKRNEPNDMNRWYNILVKFIFNWDCGENHPKIWLISNLIKCRFTTRQY